MPGQRRLRTVLLGAFAVVSTAHAADVPITGLKLIVVDKTVLASKAKAVFVAKDPSVSKGTGTDPAAIQATLHLAYDSASGAFTMPQGAGWLVNSANVAKYVNKTAPTGGGVKVSVLKPGSLVKVVGKSLGDVPLDVSAAPAGPVYVAETVVNGAQTTRLCTQFTGCAHKLIGGGTGYKLVCKGNSSGDAGCVAVPVASTTTTVPASTTTTSSSVGTTSTSTSTTTSSSTSTTETSTTSTSTSTTETSTTSTSTSITTSTSSSTSTTLPCGTFLLKWGSPGSGDGQFNNPFGIAVDASNNVFVAEYSNNRVQKFTDTGTFLSKWGSTGSGDGQFSGPASIAVDTSGNLFVADSINNRIQKFDSNGVFLTKWGSFGSGDGQFNNPRGVAVDASGNVFVSEVGGARVQKFDNAGTYLTKWTIAGSGYGVAVDPSGNVFVAITFSNLVQKFTNAGAAVTSWSSPCLALGTNAGGNVFVGDYFGHQMRRYSNSGTLLSQWGVAGSGNGQFSLPAYVATDSSGNVYVTEEGNDRVQKFACP